MSAPEPCLPACFGRFPGAVLQLSAGGVVMDSNGRLERELGHELRGSSLADVLDPESSRRKWARILALAERDPEGEAETWELILRGRDSLPEPRSFAVLWDASSRRLWMLEQRSDPRLDDLRERVIGVNSELASAQRELVKERARLASALQEVERSNRALDDFAHAVSHDLKAPLRSVASYASWLERDLGGTLGGESREHLARLQDRVRRMRDMIGGVLEYARAGRERAAPEPVDLGDLLREVVELLDPPDPVRVEAAPEMPVLVTARAPLRQVLQNLVGNAIRHAGHDGEPHVRVGARDAGDCWEISVADDGPGIPARMHERIWTLFHTGDGAGGTGIGLAVVRKLVEAEGGRVWVDSEPGSGATFRFLWPKRPGVGTRADSPNQKGG